MNTSTVAGTIRLVAVDADDIVLSVTESSYDDQAATSDRIEAGLNPMRGEYVVAVADLRVCTVGEPLPERAELEGQTSLL
jgi:hypothetical protein